MNALEHIDNNVWDNNKRIHVEKDFIMSDITSFTAGDFSRLRVGAGGGERRAPLHPTTTYGN